MKKEEIEKVAMESYQTYFHDHESKSQHDSIGQDVILKKAKLTNDVNRKKADIKNKHESLEVLRSKLTLQAEELLVNVFKESLKESNVHKMNTEEMFEELNKEKIIWVI